MPGGGLGHPDGDGRASVGNGLSDVESGRESAVVPVRGAGGDARGDGDGNVGSHTDRSLAGGDADGHRHLV